MLKCVQFFSDRKFETLVNIYFGCKLFMDRKRQDFCYFFVQFELHFELPRKAFPTVR